MSIYLPVESSSFKNLGILTIIEYITGIIQGLFYADGLCTGLSASITASAHETCPAMGRHSLFARTGAGKDLSFFGHIVYKPVKTVI